MATIEEMRQNQKILQVVREVYEKQKHTDKPTKRLATAVKKALPDHSVHFIVEFGLQELIIVPPDREYTDQLFMCWSQYDNGKQIGWWAGLERELWRCDPSDSLERMSQEESLESELASIDAEIKTLQEKIAQLRQQANDKIAALPVPESAGLRAESFFWTRPSIALASKFVYIWPEKNGA